ncbi:MAG TPA: GNAT family N-acetyltransferase [Woeseiaceae bacterium]|nr:GNAT family N-acetyltransferase [Woeseiaceae bacterium]
MNLTSVPDEIHTGRLHLRSWRQSDAARLLPVLEANVDHLGGWIPDHVATPAPLYQLELRLAGFAEDFEAARSWRYAMLSPGEEEILGEVDLFPRSTDGRVELASADRAEIGYWLRSDFTGRGLATEAAQAMLDVATALPGMNRVEIHCDPRNSASAAIPGRLGFRLGTDTAPAPAGMVWVLDLPLRNACSSEMAFPRVRG